MIGVGHKIKKIRELKNLTQEYMAEQLGVSQGTYSTYESLQTDINPDLLDDIAEILNVKREQIERFDEQIIFNNNNTINDNGIENYFGTVNQYIIDSKIEKLYEDKIRLLEEKIELLEKDKSKK